MKCIRSFISSIQELFDHIIPNNHPEIGNVRSPPIPTISLKDYIVGCSYLCMLSYQYVTKEQFIEESIKCGLPLINMPWLHSTKIDCLQPGIIKIECPNVIYIVIRGTATIVDHLTNMLHVKYVHTGWMKEAFQIASKDDYALMKECKQAGKPIIITGHSKGGLVATYLYMLFHFCTKPELHSSQVYCILFGTPSFFPKEYTEYVKDSIIHIANHNDILAHVTRNEYCGKYTTIYVGSTDLNPKEWKKAHSIKEYVRLIHTK